MNRVEHHDSLLLRGGHVIDPFAQRDEIADVFVVAGRIAKDAPRHARVLDVSGCIVCPGLMDIHVHLREPGFTHKETIETGTAAAAAGGFTYVACMPNTKPPIDSPEVLRFILDRAREIGHCAVAPVATITRGRQGRELTDFAALIEHGAVAFSDDGDGVNDDGVMRLAFEQAARTGALLIQHCEYRHLSAGGVMHLGEVSRRLGFPGLDPRSEEAMIERDIDLCRRTGARYHVAHISTAVAVEMVRRAKKDGLPVTTEVCTHHLILTHETCADADPNTKMPPPLREQADVDACREALLDGTIDCIITDHAPHAPDEKALGFLKAPAGIVGLETAVGLSAKAMLDTGLAAWPQLITWLTAHPARVLGRRAFPIQPGEIADLSILDPRKSWTVDPEGFLTKSRNTPFAGWKLGVSTVATVRGDQMRVGRRPSA